MARRAAARRASNQPSAISEVDQLSLA